MSPPKAIVVFFQEPESTLVVFGDGPVVSRTVTTSVHSLSRLLRSARLRNKSIHEVYLVIDDIPTYHSLITEVAKTREELIQLWDIDTRFLAYRELVREGRFAYMGYSYSPQLLQRYIQAFRNTGCACRAILPLDFLYQGDPVQIVQANHSLRVRLFDGLGGMYTATLFRSAHEQTDVTNIGHYALREHLLSRPPQHLLQSMLAPAAFTDQFFERIIPTSILYSQETHTTKRSWHLNNKQKAALIFVVLVGVLVGIAFGFLALKVQGLSRDIRILKRDLVQRAPHITQLQTMEVQTQMLHRLGKTVSPEVASLMQSIHAQQGIVTEFTYATDKKLMSVVVLDAHDGRNAVIKACQKNPLYSAVNLIYMRAQGKYIEYKLIVTVR